MKLRLLSLLQEIHVYLLMKGVLAQFYCNKYVLDILHTVRQRVESLILSSQISTDPQRRVFLGGETIQLTFNIGMVRGV